MVDKAKALDFVKKRIADGASVSSVKESLKSMGLKDSEIETVLKEADAEKNVVKVIVFTGKIGKEGEGEDFTLFSTGKVSYSLTGGDGVHLSFRSGEDKIDSAEALEIFEKVRNVLQGVKLKRRENVFDSLNFEGRQKGFYTLQNFSEAELAVTPEMPQFSAMEGILAPLRLRIIEKNSKKPLGFFGKIFKK